MKKDVTRDAKNKAARYCAYRERAPAEVHEKLLSLGLPVDEIEPVLEELTEEGFFNEHRFTRSYAHGKLRLKKWGKLKIKAGLERHKIDSECIAKVLESIPDDEYLGILKQLVERKWPKVKTPDPYVKKHKVAQYVMSKGFEPGLIWDLLNQKTPASY